MDEVRDDDFDPLFDAPRSPGRAVNFEDDDVATMNVHSNAPFDNEDDDDDDAPVAFRSVESPDRDQNVPLVSPPESPAPSQHSAGKQPAVEYEKIDAEFHVTVSHPQKIGDGMQAYTTYRINTLTSLPQYKQKNSCVTRRYSEFQWLHDQLKNEHKAIIIPPMPGKALTHHFNAEFVEYRQRELERFLMRITEHPALYQSATLQLFLEGSDQELNKRRNQSSADKSIASKVFSFFGKTASTIQTTFSGAHEIDQWFADRYAYVLSMEQHFAMVAHSAAGVIRRREDLRAHYTDLSGSSLQVSKNEIDEHATQYFRSLSGVYFAQAQLEEVISREQRQHFEEAVRDYIRYLGEVKSVLNYRFDMLCEMQMAEAQLKAKRGAKSGDVEEASAKLEAARRVYEQVTETVRGEVHRFMTAKARDMNTALTLMVQASINYGAQMADLWKKALNDLTVTMPSYD